MTLFDWNFIEVTSCSDLRKEPIFFVISERLEFICHCGFSLLISFSINFQSLNCNSSWGYHQPSTFKWHPKIFPTPVNFAHISKIWKWENPLWMKAHFFCSVAWSHWQNTSLGNLIRNLSIGDTQIFLPQTVLPQMSLS